MRQAGRMWSNGAVHNEARVNCVQNLRFHIMIFTHCGVVLVLNKEGLQGVISRPLQCFAFKTF